MTKSKDATSDKGEVPQLSAARFFQSVESRAWTDAEKELDTIKQKAPNTHWSRGYTKALEGLMLTYKSNDDNYLYLPRVLSNRSNGSIEDLRKEFADFSSDEIHAEYDRGFFKALEEYLDAVKSLQNKVQPGQQTLAVQSTEETKASDNTRNERKEQC